MASTGSDYEFSVSAATKAAENPLEQLKQTLKQVQVAAGDLQGTLNGIGGGTKLKEIRESLSALKTELSSLKMGDINASRSNAAFEGVIKGMTDKAKSELRKFGDTASLEAKAALGKFQDTLNRGARSLSQDSLLNDVIGGKFKAESSTAALKRQIGDLTSLYNTFYDNLGRKREGNGILESLGTALSQAQSKLREVADPITATVKDARQQVRDLGAELASVVMQSDRKKQSLGARAYQQDAYSSAKSGGLTDLSDEQLKLAEKAAARIRETARGELESLKSQRSSAAAIAQKNMELERTATLEAEITAELSRRKPREVADPITATVQDARKQVRDLGAELASVVMQSDRKKQSLGAHAYQQDAYSSAKSGSLTDLTDQQLKLAEKTAARIRETTRGELESLKAQRSSAAAIAQKNRELERTSTLEAQITAELNRRKAADPITATVQDARKQVRDLGAELASVVMQSDRKKQSLGARAYQQDAYSSAKSGSLTDLTDQQLKLAEKTAARVRETTRGELESLKAQQSSAAAIAQKNRELERTSTLEAQITAELSRRKAAAAPVPKTTQEKADASWDATFARINSGGGAKLLEMQARLLVNYQAINAALQSFSFGAQFVKELDAEMRNLQAISNTTDTAMQGLRQTLIGVSEDTKFTAVEVTKAATTMSQAGLSTEQIQGAIKGVTLLATATGSDLAQSVDVATSIVGVFNVRAEEMGQVANQVTAALNLSKLTMEKLATGIQYAGNIAADNNVSFTELVTVMAAMSNAGIRGGSTLGTGIRQLMIDLQTPTDKLVAGLAKVGLTMADVDVRSKGLIGVLQTLKDAGFTTADAIQSLEVRSAAAYSAASKFTDGMAEMQRQILLSNAAVEANDIQMKAFENTWKQFTSVFGTFADQIGHGTLLALRDLTAGVSEAISALSKMSSIGAIGDAGFAAAFTAVALAAVNLVKNLSPVRALIAGVGTVMTTTAATAVALGAAAKSAGGMAAGFTAALATLRTGLVTAEGAAISFSAVMTGLVGLLGRIALPVAIFLMADSFISAARSADQYATAVDQAKARVDELNGRVQQQQEAMQSVSKQMDSYQDRAERLKTHQDELGVAILEAEGKFGGLGFTMKGMAPTFENMMRSLRDLQGKLAEDFTGNLEAQLDALGNKIRATSLQLQSLGDANKLTEILAANGETDAYNIRRLGFSTDPGQTYGQRVAANFQKLLDDPIKQMRAAFAALTGDDKTLAQLRPENVRGVDVSKIQNDLLRQGVSLLQQGASANVNEVNRTIGEVERKIIDAQRAGKDTTGLDALKSRLDKLNTGLVNIRADEQKQKDIKDNQLPAAKFMETVGPALEQQVREYKALTDTVRRQVDAAGSAKDKERVLQDNQPRLDAAKAALTSTRGGLSADQQKVFDKLMGSTMNEVDHVVENMGDDIADALDKAEKRVKQERAKRLEAQLSRLGRFSRSQDPSQGDVGARVSEVKRVGAEYMAAELGALKTQLESDKDLAGNPEEIQAALNERKLAIQERIDSTVESLEHLYDGLGKSLKLKTESAVAVINRLDKESEGRLAAAQFQDETPTRERAALIGAKKDLVSRGLANESDVVALEMEQRADLEKLDGKTLERLKTRAAELAEYVSMLKTSAEDESKLLEGWRAKAEDVTLGLRERTEAQKQYDELLHAHEATLDAITEKTAKYNEAQRGIAEKTAVVQAKSEASSGGDKWGEAWKASTQKTLESAGAFKSLQDAVIGLGQTSITQGLSGLSTFITDLTSGAKSAGEAFRDMAASFVQALLQMMAQQAAASALGMLFGNTAKTGDTSGGDSGSGGGLFSALWSGISSLFYTGGPVRYRSGTLLRLSTGSVTGVDVGRDSVNAVLRPGEFVMNTSAVDAVGEDYLAALNSQGAAALPRQMPTMPTPTQAAPVKTNVYVVSPDRAPQMGPNDVIATISNDIATGGSVKQLIKSVVAGRM